MIPNRRYPDTGESGEAYDVEQESSPQSPSPIEKLVEVYSERMPVPIRFPGRTLIETLEF